MYITAQQANDYFVSNSMWSEADAAKKLELIANASKRIDNIIFIDEDYKRTEPRYANGNTTTQPITAIPLRLVSAVAELALHYLEYPPEIISENDLVNNEALSLEVGDLPLTVQNAVNPFMRSSDINEAVTEKDDRQERKKMTGIKYDK